MLTQQKIRFYYICIKKLLTDQEWIGYQMTNKNLIYLWIHLHKNENIIN